MFLSLRGQTVPRHQEHTPFSFTYRLCIHRDMPEQLTCWQVVWKEAGITYRQWVYMMDPLPSFHLISEYVLSTLCTRHCALPVASELSKMRIESDLQELTV